VEWKRNSKVEKRNVNKNVKLESGSKQKKAKVEKRNVNENTKLESGTQQKNKS